jgi:pyrroline-5-carboxylate reductase
MPNTPATVGAGVTALAAGDGSNPRAHAGSGQTSIFAKRRGRGRSSGVSDGCRDVLLSGSGPGYIALVIEALADGGVAAGLYPVLRPCSWRCRR